MVVTIVMMLMMLLLTMMLRTDLRPSCVRPMRVRVPDVFTSLAYLGPHHSALGGLDTTCLIEIWISWKSTKHIQEKHPPFLLLDFNSDY